MILKYHMIHKAVLRIVWDQPVEVNKVEPAIEDGKLESTILTFKLEGVESLFKNRK